MTSTSVTRPLTVSCRSRSRSARWPGWSLVALLVAVGGASAPAEEHGLLEHCRRHRTLATMVTENGDLNPYAVVVAPVDAGPIHAGDVLVDNFNNVSNLQGTGGTVLDYNPKTHHVTVIARVPQHLSACPGGVGMTAAMAMLSSGWIIVGSAPSTDGSTRTLGRGGLIVLRPDGTVATVWSGPAICDPWGNIALVDHGTQAVLFVSMAGFDVPGPAVKDPHTGLPVVVRKATVLRLTVDIPRGGEPHLSAQTVVADGFGERADRDAFLVGPTGLALAADGTLYVSDAVDNRIAAIPDALTRTTSAGTGRTVTADQLLNRPLALALTPQGHLLCTNAKNGKVVEIDPKTGAQLYAQWIDTNQAQSPPGNGDLFGLAMKPDGKGFYYVQDDTNFLMEATER